MSGNPVQDGLLPLGFKPCQHPFRLRVNDCVRLDGKLGRVIRVTESAAVVLVQQAHREFTTRFDKHVQTFNSSRRRRPCASPPIPKLRSSTARHASGTSLENLGRVRRRDEAHSYGTTRVVCVET